MVPILRVRPAKRGEAGYGSLYGMIQTTSLIALSKAEIVERLRPLVQRGELPSKVLIQVDSGLPVSVLSRLGYSDEAIRKSEADALAQIRGGEELTTATAGLFKNRASERTLRQEDLTPARRQGRPVQVDEPELERLRAELERLRRIERAVKKFVDASGGPRQVHPSLQNLDD